MLNAFFCILFWLCCFSEHIILSTTLQLQNKNKLRSLWWIVTLLRPLEVHHLYATARKAPQWELHATAKINEHPWHESINFHQKSANLWMARLRIVGIRCISDMDKLIWKGIMLQLSSLTFVSSPPTAHILLHLNTWFLCIIFCICLS